MNDDFKTGYQIGQAITCMKNGIDPRDVSRLTEKQAALIDSPDMQVTLSKIAAALMKEAGYEYAPEQSLYETIILRGGVETPMCKKAYIEPVLEMLAMMEEDREDILEKNAGMPLKLLGSVGAMGGDLFRNLILAGVIGGTGVGALYWAMNRDATADESDAAVKEEQAKYYRKYADELRRKLSRNSSAITTPAVNVDDADNGNRYA